MSRDANDIASEWERRERFRASLQPPRQDSTYSAAPPSKRGKVRIYRSISAETYERSFTNVVVQREGNILTIIDSEENLMLYILEPGNYITFERTREGE